jgi:hypothetical protein
MAPSRRAMHSLGTEFRDRGAKEHALAYDRGAHSKICHERWGNSVS